MILLECDGAQVGSYLVCQSNAITSKESIGGKPDVTRCAAMQRSGLAARLLADIARIGAGADQLARFIRGDGPCRNSAATTREILRFL